MDIQFLMRHFFGFALQILPAIALMLIPFDRTNFRLPAVWIKVIFGVLCTILSAVYATAAYAIHVNHLDTDGAGFLFGNGIMCGAILIIVCLFFALVREKALHKLFLLFAVIGFSATQYSFVYFALDYLPRVPDSQLGQSYDIYTCLAYLCVTVLLFPPVAVFFRKVLRHYLKQMHTVYSRREFILLTLTTAVYLVLNALFSMFWTHYQQTNPVNQGYYVPFILLLTAMLFMVYYSVIRLSTLRAKEAERKTEAAIIRQDHERICQNMENQRERLHDTRQLLHRISVIAQSGDTDELQTYIDKTIEHIHLTDERFCSDACLNGILQYYASLAKKSGIGFSAEAQCSDLSGISQIDLTVLIGNALENAIRSAKNYRAAHSDSAGTIRFTASDTQKLFRVQIENPCDRVTYADDSQSQNEKRFLPAASFLSTENGGYGLKRIASVSAKYDGVAAFRYDREKKLFITRITMVIPE